MATDLRIASEGSKFGIPIARLGILIGYSEMRRLISLVGPGNASYLLLSGRIIDSEEAFEMGLADKIVPLEKIRDAAMELAEEIAISSPLGVLETRATLRSGLAERVRVATDHELKIQNELRQTEDFKEGVAATAERRIPNFQGR